MSFRFASWSFTLAFAVLPRPAQAALPKTHTTARALALAAELGLPTREVEVGPSWSPVTRIVLPLKPEHWGPVIDALGLHKNPETGKYEGNLIYRQFDGDMTFVAPEGLDLGGRKFDVVTSKAQFSSAQLDKPAIVVHLTPAQADYVGRWLEARQNDRFLRIGSGCSDMMMNVEVEPGSDGAHTVRPVSRAEAESVDPSRVANGQQPVPGSGVRMGKTIAQHTGVRASKKGAYMMMKWIWSANENVQVVLIADVRRTEKRTERVRFRRADGQIVPRNIVSEVRVPADFAALSVDELLGPQHPHGVDEAARPPDRP